MRKSEQRYSAAITDQVAFWNTWNATSREHQLDSVSLEQAMVIDRWLTQLGRYDLDIIEVGCGAGWLCDRLTKFGRVTGTDLSHEVLARAANRWPSVNYVAGDFMQLDFPERAYDVVITLEVLAHVADQAAFVRKLSRLLRPGGTLMLATQNRPQLERNDIPPPAPGQIRHWVDATELRQLLQREFRVVDLLSITPRFNRGYRRVFNSPRLAAVLSGLGLSSVVQAVKVAQERAGWGWTLICRAVVKDGG